MEFDHWNFSFIMQKRTLARKELCFHVRNRQIIKCVKEGIDYDKAKDRGLTVRTVK